MKKLAWKVTGLSYILMLSLPYIAVASSSDSELGDLSSGAPKIDSSYIFDVIWVFVALGIVIALLVVTIKFLSKRNRMWGSQKGLRSHGGIGLGQNSSLQVIEVANRIYILGVGEQITLIDKEDDPERIAEIIAELEQSSQGTMNLTTLKQWFNGSKHIKQAKAHNSEQQIWNDSSSFEDLLLSKLDKQAERKQELESLLKDKNK